MPGSSIQAKATSPRVKASAINYLIDAGPLVALLDRRDQWHRWSASILGVLDEQLLTTETVIAEACHHLHAYRPALHALISLVAERRIALFSPLSHRPERVGILLEKYPLMDVGDATLVILSELYPRARLITTDTRDFTVYRRRDGKPVPCLMPPV